VALPTLDLAIILVYLVGVVALGVFLHRAGSRGINAYFLGENQTRWWVLAASGSSSYFDITGTMWIVSLFMLYGVRGMWEQCIWGFFYAAFFMTFMGKWIRRSNALTGAEWMGTRFGQGAASEAARGSYAFLAVITIIAFLAYGSVGIGKFGQTFLPGSVELGMNDVKDWSALCSRLHREGSAERPSVGRRIAELLPPKAAPKLREMIRLAAEGKALEPKQKVAIVRTLNGVLKKPELYTEEAFQGVAIPAQAQEALGRDRAAMSEESVQRLNRLLLSAACPTEIAEAQLPRWTRNECALVLVVATSLYAIVGGFVSIVLIDLVHTVVLSAGVIVLSVFAFVQTSGSQAVQTFANGDMGSLVPPWRMDPGVAGAEYEMFGLLVICWLVKGLVQEFGGPPQMFDFQRFLAARNGRDACKIGALWGVLHILRWPLVAAIVVLALAGAGGEYDPEKVLPTVLREYLPPGLRGFTLAALFAAFMSTFDATINAGASYAVRDLYQRYLRPKATQRELVYAGYTASALLVIVGVLIGFGAQTIAQMFQWIMLALGAGVMIPCILRWYWWRFNGWGFTVGTLSGILTALIQAKWFPESPIYSYFPIIVGVNLLASLLATLLTEPTDRETLKRFYMTVQPGGWWKPIAREVAAEHPDFRRESFARDLLNTLIAMPWIIALYLFPIFLMFRQWATMGVCLAIAGILSVVLYFTWYKHLPQAEASP